MARDPNVRIAEGPVQEVGSSASGPARIVDLTGESPELVAFVLLRYIAQLERQSTLASGVQTSFDRKWLLDSYAECLEAVKGNREIAKGEPAAEKAPPRAARGAKK